ncbi:phosphatase PAP2 family protein [Variovorax humicola]|uniref:Phosphatase PAP2 family protein n=1 Tax=Variovorax humicola TaxID=1769758 RepID=A0ABU8W0J1_9BURK
MNHLTDAFSAPAPPPWKAEMWLRFRRLFWLKLVGTSVFTWLFFIGYFHLLRHPAAAVMVMPLTPLDHLIPFLPEWLPAYLTLWIYVGVAPGLQRNFAELVVYGLWVGALCLSGLALFYLWPTAVPPLTIDVSGYAGFAMLQGVDASGNACPSMHVAVAIFTALRLDDVFRQARTPVAFRMVNALWFLAIVWSTMAVKQHVVLDAVAGALLGLAFVLPSLHWRPTPHRVQILTNRADIISYQ